MQLGSGFFRAASRPSRDLGVLLARTLAAQGPLQVLDLMAGCGIRALRYGLEAGADAIWANDADAERLPLLQANLEPLAARQLRITAHTAQQLLADCFQRQQRFSLVDLDAFGCPTALVPMALEAVSFDGVLYLASTDGRSPTGHDRPAALRHWGAAARSHPASWELALRLQLGVVARTAWAMGRGVEPLFSFSEGRTFRTAVRLLRQMPSHQEGQLGLVALCHGCGEQQVQSLLRLRQWQRCACGADEPSPLAISGPLWIGPLQQPSLLEQMGAMADGGERHEAEADGRGAERLLARPSRKLLQALAGDPGCLARCWPTAELARRLQTGPPPLGDLVASLRCQGHQAWASGVMAGQVRSDAPWPVILQTARELADRAGATAK